MTILDAVVTSSLEDTKVCTVRPVVDEAVEKWRMVVAGTSSEDVSPGPPKGSTDVVVVIGYEREVVKTVEDIVENVVGVVNHEENGEPLTMEVGSSTTEVTEVDNAVNKASSTTEVENVLS